MRATVAGPVPLQWVSAELAAPAALLPFTHAACSCWALPGKGARGLADLRPPLLPSQVDMLWLDAATCSAAFKDIYPFPFADNSYTQTCVGAWQA